MEYYFQDQLRWTWGFDNPNKTAAFVATLVPFLWMAYALGWNAFQRWKRVVAIVFTSILLLAGWSVLVKTYSRGGLVAAALATGYLCWQTRKESRWFTRQGLVSMGIFLAIGIFTLTSGAAHRSTQWIGAREGSVENRFELWQGSLRMIASLPQGVGTGNSGNFYMQWFQPLDSKSSYRTLVNSYLTFTAEQGLLAFGLAVFIFSLFWFSISYQSNSSTKLSAILYGCRASLLSFIVSGFFTTTMEEPMLWVLPTVAMVVCLVISFKNPCGRKWLSIFKSSLVVSTLLCSLVFLWGEWLLRGDMLTIRLQRENGFENVVATTPRQHNSEPLYIAVDKAVLGQNYGKLVRRLATAKNIQIFTSLEFNPETVGRWVLVTGDQVGKISFLPDTHGILLAPSKIDDVQAEILLQTAPKIKLLIADFDEDGRVAFWKEKAALKNKPVLTLTGQGTQIEWAWDIFIQKLEP
jgi:hypothetical protein